MSILSLLMSGLIAALVSPAEAHSWSANNMARERASLVNFSTGMQEAVMGTAVYLLESQRYDGLEYGYLALENGRGFLPGNVSRLGAFYGGLIGANADGSYPSEEEMAAFQDQREIALKAWLAARPQSAAAHVALSALYLERAWRLRGDRFAELVTQRQWEGFHAEMEKSARALDGMTRPDPVAYGTLISMGMGLGWPAEIQTGIYDAAVRDFPAYPNMQFYRAIALLPRWGGSIAELCALAQSVAQLQDKVDGTTYSAVADGIAVVPDDLRDVMATGCIDWDLLKQSYGRRIALGRIGEEAANVYLWLAVMRNDHDAARQVAPVVTRLATTCWKTAEAYKAALRWAKDD